MPPPPTQAAFIQTPWDRIPNFGQNYTIYSVQDGPWSDPATWDQNRVPAAGDVVIVQSIVTYDALSDAAIKTVSIIAGGLLQINPALSTRLTVVNLLVCDGGQLDAMPPSAGCKAEIVFADVPLDTVNDPSQYGNVLMALGGKVNLCGTEKTGIVRLGAEPLAGATMLTFATPVVGWIPGDKLLLPDSRQLRAAERGLNYVPQWETATISTIAPDGLSCLLTAPLAFNHKGHTNADGVLEFLPHVGNLTRNVVIRSANASGTRGHTFFHWRADVDIRYCTFGGLGRTKKGAFDNTTYNAQGQVTHVGTNQEERYPLHFNHLMGPTTPQANGYQTTSVGNVVQCPLDPMPYRWGYTLYDSHYGLHQANVIYNWYGAGLCVVTGSESQNVIDGNFVCRVNGTGNRGEQGTGGDGYWLRTPNNRITNNVACCIQGSFGQPSVFSECYGFSMNLQYVGVQRIPNSQGADTSVAGQFTSKLVNSLPLGWDNNETYNSPDGYTWWWIGLQDAVTPVSPPVSSVMTRPTAWHVWRWGMFPYQSANLTIDHFVCRGSLAYIEGSGITHNDYTAINLVVTNADIQGRVTGIYPSCNPRAGQQTFAGCFLRNLIDVQIDSPWTSAGTSSGIQPRTIHLDDNVHRALPGQSHTTIKMQYATDQQRNLAVLDQTFVTGFDDGSGGAANFQVFYTQQAGGYLMPATTFNANGSPKLTACAGLMPVSGKTNAQAWTEYQVAIGGAVAPANATTRAGIVGLVA